MRWDVRRQDSAQGSDQVYTRGTPNGWDVYNLVYASLGNATPDYCAAKRRSFDDTYNSVPLLALDITRDKKCWHQTAHHDLWDFDLPVGSSLFDLFEPNGTTIPALVQASRAGPT